MRLIRRILLFATLSFIAADFLDLPIYVHYADVGPEHDLIPEPGHRRSRRDTTDDDDDNDFANEGWRLPDDVEEEQDSSDHIYYQMTTSVNSTEEVNKYFVDVETMLKQKDVVGNLSHIMLSKSHRKAVGVNLTFIFPFYGHKMANVTIATGGFIYIGDQTHSWLAATQYIAPLMANFNTHLDGSDILYADDGQKFVCEWRKVQLRGQETEGPFTFQLTLFKNGDIVFVYKEVPTAIANISDHQHPVKLGISDAYLFQHRRSLGIGATKRVIYEYHRIEVPHEKAVTNSVVFLKAQPTCMGFATCDECSNSTLLHFNCSWCHAKKENGGPFCTDQAGLHRRRQHWIENNCKEQGRSLYCKGSDDDEVADSDESTGVPSAPSTTPTVNTKTEMLPTKEKSEPPSGMSTLLLIAALIVTIVGWLAYAYYNPHTPSGQLLIKYRPSRWRAPMSHVRYSASVHM